MPKALAEVTRDAMELTPAQQLALAGFLLESAEGNVDPEAESAWESEIKERLRAVDEDRVKGVSYQDVLRAAESRLVP